MLTQLRLFMLALQFFTRVPVTGAVARWVGFSDEMLRASSRFFPLVGLLVGAVAAAVFAGASMLWPAWIAAVLTLAASALLTGAFHEDGLADYVDGMGGGQTKARVLEIMKDSRIGSYGALALALATLLKAAALAQMSVAVATAALLLAHPLARACACGVLAGLNYVRDDDAAKSKPLAQSMRPLELLFAVTTVAALAVALIWWQAALLRLLLAAVLAASLTTIFMARHMKRRIGGFTGDALGAVEQMVEVSVLLVFAISL